MAELKDKIKALVDESGETVYAIAKETKISQTAIAMYIKGDYKPKLENLQKLAEHFNVPLSYFIE